MVSKLVEVEQKKKTDLDALRAQIVQRLSYVQGNPVYLDVMPK